MNDIAVVSCDWLALSCQLLHPFSEDDKFTLPQGWSMLEMSATATWMRRWFVMDRDGTKLATFLCSPRSTIIPECRAMLEISNVVLYSDIFHNVLDATLTMLPMVADGVSRVDLCADFEMSDQRWQVTRGLEAGEYYLKGLRRGVNWWSSKKGNAEPHQLQWGGLESVFKWKLYNKYKELHAEGTAACSKPYIEEMWRLMGLQPSKVWRLEVSITQCNRVMNDANEVISIREWYNDRVHIYSRIYSDKFIIRQHEGHVNARYDPIVAFLPIEGNQPKFFRHRPAHREMESDVERRVVCKMWKEYTDPEVRARDTLKDAIRQFLFTMFQFDRNIQAVARRFNITVSEVIDAIENG